MIKRFASPVISDLSFVVANMIINGDLHDH
jgi:hypothetical protein